jgi:hypothetical protein
MRWLIEEHGRDPVRAGSDALAILRADLLNDVRLVPLQVDTTRCLVCEDVGRSDRPLAPFLSARPDDWLWLHLEPCHAEYLRRQKAKIEQILEAVLEVGPRSSRVLPDHPTLCGTRATTRYNQIMELA